MKITTTLLQHYQHYLDHPHEGATRAFINKINHPQPDRDTVQATALTELVDLYLLGQTACMAMHHGIIRYRGFAFSEALVKDLAERLEDAIPQVSVSAPLCTSHGTLQLYGRIDELLPGRRMASIITANSHLQSCAMRWEHVLLPYCLQYTNNHLHSFTYLITDLHEIREEHFEYTTAEHDRLVNACEGLAELIASPGPSEGGGIASPGPSEGGGIASPGPSEGGVTCWEKAKVW